MGSYSKIRHIQESNRILENRLLNEQSTAGLTINQMLQGKEFPGLTKQEQGDTVYYSLLDGQKRKWFVSFRITPNNWIETKITSTNPQFFEKVKITTTKRKKRLARLSFLAEYLKIRNYFFLQSFFFYITDIVFKRN